MHARQICTAALLVAFVSSTAFAQRQADTDAVNKVIDRYGATDEAGDMAGQAKLMSPDRVWISNGIGRRTDQAANMKIQQAQSDGAAKWIPGIQWFVEDRDRLIRFYGDGSVAVASFYRYMSAVLPATTPPDLAKGFSVAPPASITLVLEKKGGEWKIVHTHMSAMDATGVK